MEVPTPDMVLPDVGDCETVAEPQLSDVDTALYEGNATVQAAPKVTVCVAGQVIVGAILSILFTPNEQEAVLPFPSLAVKTTVVVPTAETAVPKMGDWVKVGVVQLSAILAGL